jgi:hypothetical protein
MLPFDRLMDDPADSIQRYDLTCAAPYKTLPSTVIPGWLWSGMMDDAGMQNIPICGHTYTFVSHIIRGNRIAVSVIHIYTCLLVWQWK